MSNKFSEKIIYDENTQMLFHRIAKFRKTHKNEKKISQEDVYKFLDSIVGLIK